MKSIYFLLILTLFVTNNTNSKDFVLKGKLTGFEDGFKIVLNPYLDNMDVDMDNETTLLLKDGCFEFSRHLDKPTKYSLRVRPKNSLKFDDYEDLVFWAENVPMTLTGVKGEIFQAKVSGSSIQDQFYQSVLGVAGLRKIIKQTGDSAKMNPNLPEAVKSKMRKIVYPALEEVDKRDIDFAYTNPNFYSSAPTLVSRITFMPDKIDLQRLRDTYNSMKPEIQTNVYGKQIQSFLKKVGTKVLSKALEVGDSPINFTLNDTSGKPIQLSGIKQRVVLLNFWGSGCGPCRVENKKYFSKLYNDFKDKGLEIVSVSSDQSKKRLINAMNEDKISWVSLWDEKKEVSNYLYQIPGLPTNFLIIDGKIAAISPRFEDLSPLIEKALN